jgi:hypothetical protein
LQTEWQASDARSDRERVDRARQDAENLFRPRQQGASADAQASATNGPSSAEDQPRRQPRVFMIPPAVPMSAANGTAPAGPEPIRRQRAVGGETRKIPASQFGRVRALASYGMTSAQVAELYGVGVDEIERIISRSDASGTA